VTLPGIFSQRDSRWSNAELGYNTDPYYNIYHFGCLITGIANLIWETTGDASWTPLRVNQWLQDNAGFAPGGGLVIWSQVASLLSQFSIQPAGYSTDLAAVNQFLADDNNFAIAQLTAPGFPMHFSVMPYVDMIADSWDATLKHVEAYSFIGGHLYTKSSPQPVTIPAEPVPAEQTPVVPPTPEVMSTTTPIPAPEPAPTSSDVVSSTAPVQVTGQASGDVSVTVVDSRPEYERSYTPFADPTDKVLQRAAFAKDLTGEGQPVEFKEGTPTKLAGELTYEGKKYFRGADSANKGAWYCIEAEAYQNDLASTFLGIEQEAQELLSKAATPLAKLIRSFGKKN